MKITLSNFGWLLSGGLLIVLLILLLKDGCGNPGISITQGDSLIYWKNKAGEVASLKQKEEDYFTQQRAGFLDSIAKLHNTKVKYIKEVVTVTEQGSVKIENHEVPVIKYVDSNNCPTVLYQAFENPYYIVEAQLDVTGASSSVKLETIDTLSVVWHEAKEGSIFNRRTFLQMDVQNTNPYNHITGATLTGSLKKSQLCNKWIKPALVGIAASAVTYQLTKK